MTVDRLRALLGGPETAWIVARLVARMRRGEGLTGPIRHPSPSPAERDAHARLFGRYGRGDTLTVDLGELACVLRDAGLSTSLEDAVTTLVGPVDNRRELARRRQARWDAAWAEVEDPRPAVMRAWSELRDEGTIRRLGGDDPVEMLRAGMALCRALPAAWVPLPELAARLTGDAHALDPGRPLATIGLRLARAIGGGDDRRAIWAGVGVEVDPLSATALVLGLRVGGDGLVARLLASCAAVGEPCRLTLRQLRRDPVVLDAEEVFVCENPAVVLAAAERLGPACRPLVCVEGQPGSAAWALLGGAGARVRYHGDFDWPGVRIAADVLARTGGRPWRFDAAAYADAPRGIPLVGDPVATPWDPALAARMVERGTAVHEEAGIDGLLRDLHAR